MEQNPWIREEPHPKQQQFLLHTHTREVFYGGAGGGGKSQSLWYGALQYVDVPGYAALILRRTYADLSKSGALMERAQEYLAGTGATWNGGDKRWTFPSGATVGFGYLDTERDKFKYASAEYQYIAFDELTHFGESQYSFLFTRLRKRSTGALAAVPLRMRSASNPGGVGHDWVKSRFVKPETRKPGRVFIPAKLADNPSIDRAEYVESLTNTDPLTRDQIEHGDWEAHAGGRFRAEWLRHYCPEPGTEWLRFGEHLYTTSQLTDRFITVDSAATVKKASKPDPDYTAISTWARTPCGYLVWIACRILRCEIPEIPGHVWEQYRRFGAQRAFVEDNGVGKGAAQLCQRHTGHMNVIPFATVKEKLVNATNAMCMCDAGRVWLPMDNPNFPLDEVEAQLLRFTGDPKVDAHDDVVDTLSKAANVVLGREPKQKSGKRGTSVAHAGFDL